MMRVRDGIKIRPCPPQYVGRVVREWKLEPEILHPAYRHVMVVDGKELVGLVTAFPMHPVKPAALIVEHMFWKPGLSRRRLIECAYVFGTEGGKNIRLVGYSRPHDYKFFDTMRKLGVLRKVGKQRAGFERMVTVWETPSRGDNAKAKTEAKTQA